MSKEVATQTNLQALSGFLKSDKITAEIQKVLGRKPDSFVTSALTAIKNYRFNIFNSNQEKC